MRFVVVEGQATFTLGAQERVVHACEIAVAPAGVPHRFVNSGPGRLRQVDALTRSSAIRAATRTAPREDHCQCREATVEDGVLVALVEPTLFVAVTTDSN
jgi:uncharacterized cupin superfamily protein